MKNEFVSLMNAAGWSQAETARQLQITPGAVSQICSGKTVPRASTLNLMKLLIARQNPKALELHETSTQAGLEPWAKQLVETLRGLPDNDRDRLLTPIRDMIGAFQAAARRRVK